MRKAVCPEGSHLLAQWLKFFTVFSAKTNVSDKLLKPNYSGQCGLMGAQQPEI